MGKFILKKKDFLDIKTENGTVQVLKTKKFDEFNESILNLGDIKANPEKIDALCAIFDLEGFTDFCNQRDPELSVSLFLSEFLSWILTELKEHQVSEKFPEGAQLFADLPFMCKFMGDGLLVLWETEPLGVGRLCNIIVLIDNLCNLYKAEFYPLISKRVVNAPKVLRSGVAKGTVFSIGNGEDYVGSCINVAARLQKFNNLNFCFSTMGIDYDKGFKKITRDKFLIKKVRIRGIGEEIIGIRKKEFEDLDKNDQKDFEATA